VAASDVMYANALTAQFTVLTLPEDTLNAVAERGELRTLLRADGGKCETSLDEFRAAGIDLYALAAQLQDEGTQSFVNSWNELMSVITAKVSAVTP
jgi:transaldolase